MLAHVHVYLAEFFWGLFGLLIALLLPALCSYGFECFMHLRRGCSLAFMLLGCMCGLSFSIFFFNIQCS